MPVTSDRRPPEILRLAPPLMPLRRVRADVASVAAIVSVIAVAGLGVVYAIGVTVGRGSGLALTVDLLRTLLPALVCILAVPVLVLPVGFWARYRQNRDAQRWRVAHPMVLGDPRAAAVQAEWDSVGRPDHVHLVELLRGAGPAPLGCTILCTEGTEPPPAVDALVEPVVISPGGIVPSPRTGIPLAVALALLALVIPLRWFHLSAGGFLAAFGVALLGALIWHFLLRARYVRFSPGLVEVLRYGPFGGPPQVARYPLKAETTLFISNRRAGSLGNDDPAATTIGWHMVVCTPQGVTEIWFSVRGNVTEHVWHALLSSAPVPPLPYETL